MDYNAEMLRLYFKENNYSKEKIQYLLEHNPFDLNYTNWEKQKIEENKMFATYLKRKCILKKDTNIQEISNHVDNVVGKYLYNEIMYTPCPIGNDINNIRLNNRFILFKGFYKNEINFLKKLEYLSNPYVTGICTRNYNYYEFVLKNYKCFLEKLNKSELIQEENDKGLLLMLKSK